MEGEKPMTQGKFQEHVLKELGEIKNLFIKYEQDHADLSTRIESVRTEVESVRADLSTSIESVRTEMHKQFNIFLRWSIGTIIASVGVAFLIAKYIS